MKGTLRLSKGSINYIQNIEIVPYMNESILTVIISSSVKVSERCLVLTDQETSGLFFINTHIAEYPPISTKDVKFWVHE